MTELDMLIGIIWRSPHLEEDISTICGFGGRFAGSPSEMSAIKFVKERLEKDTGCRPNGMIFPGAEWQRGECQLSLLAPQKCSLPVTSLVRCPEVQGAELKILDLGRGVESDFKERQSQIKGKAVLVQHEYPFSLSHIHRRRKYNWAKNAGATAFIIANHMPGIGVVTGSACQGLDDDIPAVGTSYEGGRILSRAAREKDARIFMNIKTIRANTKGENVILDIPGRSDEYVVLCAHIDGHDLAESAIDNASGVAVVLEAARRLYPIIPKLERGLRIILFSYEEWALLGSRLYLESLSEDEKKKMRLAINLDSVVGSSNLSALVSNRMNLASFIEQTAKQSGPPIQIIWPLQPNSDHYNFHVNGIPSFRLIAGYEEPNALTRFLLTPADTRDKVDIGQLRLAAMTTVNLVYEACALPNLLGSKRNA